ncbi:DNA-directed RNA polymerase II subunit RPB2-like [Apium graveolens]|uniref:DNA-directed RNA polymerase II subunit RPB2-like n=1 Tax=Apium graveolens TaxID=4045 RepID=UPI003D799FA8
MEVSQEDVREVIHTYFNEHSFVKQQMDSCNNFYDENMQKTIDDLSTIVIKSSDDQIIYKIFFGQISLDKPEVTEPAGDTSLLYPRDARVRNLSYSGALSCDITITSGTDEVISKHEKFYIGKVPIMVKSKFCNLIGLRREELCRLGEDPDDIGGYFIVNGIERVLIGQERMRNNHVFVSKTNPDRNEYIAELRSSAACQSRPPSIVKVHMMPVRGDPSKMCIRATLPYIRSEIPIAIIFRGLGVHSEGEIMGCIGIDRYDAAMANLIRPSLDEARILRGGQQEALDYIGRRGKDGVKKKSLRIKFAEDTLGNMLPHTKDVKNPDVSVACNFGYIIYRLLQCALLRRREDDKNHYINKRIDLSGPLLNDLFRKLFIGLKQDTRAYAKKIVVKRGKELKPDLAITAKIITEGFRHALASGNWDDTTVGVSQVLHRLTYVATFSHLRRLNSTFGYLGSQTKPRQLHNSQWGRICPAETPEGQACGLVKNMALMAHVTVGSFENQISKLLVLEESRRVFMYLKEAGKTAFEAHIRDKVFLNGCLLGFHSNGDQLVSELRQRKRMAAISSEVGVVLDIKYREVRISTDYGRCTRPLLVVENKKILMKKEDVQELKQDGSEGKWDKLIRKGYLEYIDADEEETTMISMTPKDLRESEKPDENNVDQCTHCELHPSLILGISASMIPFPEHNKSYRNTIQASANKQAIGTYASNFHYRMDPSSHFLYYPQKPLVGTWMTHQLQSTQLAGVNAIVAISCYSGFNQGDSVIMNQSSIDRGLFRSMLLRSYSDNVRRMGTLFKEDFGRPNRADTMGMRKCTYANIDSDGLVHPGTLVYESDVLIGKTARIEQESASQANYTQEDRSTYLRPYQRGRVDRVMITTNTDGLALARVRVRSVRVPEVGDKFSSRHGQKGLIGMTLTQEELPWTVDGITPDIIINPHSFPSRMTIGQLLESIMGKAAAHKGWQADATPFTDVTVEEIEKKLHKCGFKKNGKEAMCTGETGRFLSARIFIGPTFYMKLAHMVEDKLQCRARGCVQKLTRQPTQGRLQGGGLRFGEMERDCLISHGSALNLKERLFELSDKYYVNVCGSCGYISKTKNYCKICEQRSSGISQVPVPYAWKLLCQELMAMGISSRMGLDKH